MAWDGKLTRGLMLVLLAAISSPFSLARTAAFPLQIAQVPINSVTGSLDRTSRIHFDGSYFNVHTFEGTAGEIIRIDMVSTDFDAYLILFGPGGGRITQDNSSGGGTNARIIATLPVSGTYQIAANAYRAGETGQYTVTWGRATAQDANSLPAATITQIITGAILGQPTEPPEETSSPEETIAEAILGELLSQPQTSSAVSSRGDALQRATLLNQQAVQLYQAGQYDEAEPLLEESVAIWREEVGDRGPGMAEGLSGLALIYRTQGRYNEAAATYEEVLSIERDNLDDRHPDVALSLSNLAAVYQNQSRYGEAAAAYEEAIRIWRGQTSYLDRRHFARFVEDLRALASTYFYQGQYEAGEPFVQEALSIYREQNDPLGIAASLSNLATLRYAQEQYDEAEKLQQEALGIERNNRPSAAPSIGNNLNNLGLIYLAQKKYQQAETALQEALLIRRQADNPQAIAQTMHNLATLYYEQQRLEEAESLLSNALSIRREFAATTGETAAVDEPLFTLAKVYLAQDNFDKALNALREGLDIQERYLNINLATTADTQRRAYAATLSETTDQVIALSINSAVKSPPADRLAMTTLLRRKGRILDTGVNNLQVLRQNLTVTDQAILDELISIRQQLAALTFNRPHELPPDHYRERLNKLEAQDNELASTLARRSVLFRTETTPVEIAAVQSQLPSKSVLLEYVRYRPFDAATNQWQNPRYAAYLLFPNGQIEAVDLGDAAEIEAAVQSFTRLLQDSGADLQRAGATPVLRREVVEDVTDRIHALAFAPILPYLQDIDHLLISPDGQLNLLPFEALQTEAGGEYLVQQYQISYLNSGRDLLRFGLTDPNQNPAVILADPDYETAQVDQNRGLGEGLRSTELTNLQFGRLPGTAAEVKAIQPLLPNPTILTEDQATENALKQVQSPKILHIATHGFFLSDVERPLSDAQRGLSLASSRSDEFGISITSLTHIPVENPLLRSGLALAGFNSRSSGTEDGVFTALEASQLNLFGTQLVVLSACETGLGDIANGEGIYGLRRAFALAGAESQLMSLWQVSDYGTQNLMARFYENLTAGMGRSEALREVQLEMIAEGGQYSSPYYWAAFILAGNWQDLEY